MKLTRSQLAKFLPDNDSIRAFEELSSTAEKADAKTGAQTLLGAVSANSTTLVTAASIPLNANALYRFEFIAAYTSSVGTRWVIDGPATTVLAYSSRYPLSDSTETVNHLGGYNLPASANASSPATGIARIDGIIKASASGSLQFKFAAASASPVAIVGGYVRLIHLT